MVASLLDTVRFADPGVLVDGDLELSLATQRTSEPNKALVAAYLFHMHFVGTRVHAGHIDLRIGNTEMITRYSGHIGYRVNSAYRGQHLAARSVKLLFPLAREHHLVPLWITCNPENTASRRTCEIACGKLVDIVAIPNDCSLYLLGDRQKCRYRFDI